jgi:putative CocE/NonD family hydrolase
MHGPRAFIARRTTALAAAAIVAALGGFARGDRGDLAASQAPAALQAEAPACTFTVQNDVATPMRDGVILRSNVYTPDSPGPFPILLVRTPYNKDRPFISAYGGPDVWAGRCYIVVAQDVRGQYKSDGTWYPFRSEATDGYDAIEWAAALPKSNGKVGMYGFSYPGATQWLPATLRPPHLTAIIPAMTSSDYRDGWTYEGGALYQAFTQYWPMNSIANSAVRRFPDGEKIDAELNDAQQAYAGKWKWFLPLKDYPPLRPQDPRVAPYHFDWLKHPDDDDYWKPWSIRRQWSQVIVPVLNFEGWYDLFLNGGIENFVGMRKNAESKLARDGQRLVIGPWVHLGWQQVVGDIDFGPEAVSPMPDLMRRWYDYWLKGIQNGVDKEPRVKVFVMGANKWRTADEWPIPGTEYRRYYLHSKGGANTESGDGSLDTTKPTTNEPADRYTYDPRDPVPSVGGRFQQVVLPGPRDQRPVLSRKDVLVYTTAPLTTDLEVTGPITVSLHAASSARDTDFTAKLDDVYPDGTSMLITYGIQRARYRESQSRQTLLTPGRIYEYTIQVWPTSNVFKAGHRIRLEISSSNFPMFDRNPIASDAELVVAEQTVFHENHLPSMITLPIVTSPIK